MKIHHALIGKYTGQSSSNWRGGVSFEPYGIEFNNKLKEQIRKRDNYICQECGIHQDELVERLSVHHIDFNKNNNNILNLITLCRKCHSKTICKNIEYWVDYYKNEMLNIVLHHHNPTLVEI